ncbi:MAG: hypothetical protein FD123_1575 [Bacteroidetes bacterium]|nr:MAG: hypothetical protein FD123_1575 [Bacteroidota bacterium]
MKIWKNILITLLTVTVLVLAWIFLKKIIIYLCVAGVISLMVQPLLKRLEKIRIKKRKIPRGIRALIVLLGIYIVIGTFIAIFIPLIIDEIKIISNIDQKQLATAMQEPAAQLESIFSRYQQQTGNTDQSMHDFIQESVTSVLGFAQVSSLANSLVAIVGNLFVAFFVISFLLFFFMKDGPVIFETVMLLFPKKRDRAVRNIIQDTRKLLTKYFTGVLLDVLFVATFISVGMAILGIKNALIIGLFAGAMNIIPYVGPLIGGAFAIIVGLSTNLQLEFYTGMLPLAGKISLVFVLMNLTDGFFIQPTIFSNSVKAHPLEIFLVILIAGTLAGIGGMILAVPIYTIIRVIAREFLSHHKVVQRLTDELDEVTDPDPPQQHDHPET